MSQIAVFWLHLLFWLLQKHRKYQCFGSILGLRWYLRVGSLWGRKIDLFRPYREQPNMRVALTLGRTGWGRFSGNNSGFNARCDILGSGAWGGRQRKHFLSHKHCHTSTHHRSSSNNNNNNDNDNNDNDNDNNDNDNDNLYYNLYNDNLFFAQTSITFTTTVSMSLSCAGQHRRFCEA